MYLTQGLHRVLQKQAQAGALPGRKIVASDDAVPPGLS